MPLESLYIARHGFRTSAALHKGFVKSSASTVPHLSDSETPPAPLDFDLTAHGAAQAHELADFMKNKQIDAIISSPYTRCVKTADPIAATLDLPICIEPGLSEWYPPGDAPHSYPAAPSASLHSSRVNLDWQPLYDNPTHNGESIESLHHRVKHVFSKLEDRAREQGYRSILVVSHAATIIALGRAVMDDASFNLRTGCCALSQFARSPGSQRWVCTQNGDASHLERGEERHWEFGYLGIDLHSDLQRPAKL